MNTPADRCRLACPEEWTTSDDQILVYIVEPAEADGHDPAPPYHHRSTSGTPWYDTRLGNAVCWAFIISFFVVLPWAIAGWRLDVAT